MAGEQGLAALIMTSEFMHGRKTKSHAVALDVIAKLEGKVEGALIGALRLRVGPAAHRDQGRTQSSLEAELPALAVGDVGEPRQGPESALQLSDGFSVGIALDGVGGGKMEVTDRPVHVTRGNEVHGQCSRDAPRVRRVSRLQRLANLLMQADAAAGGNSVVNDFLVERMRKRECGANRAVGPFDLPGTAQELAATRKRSAPALGLLGGNSQRRGNRGGREFNPGNRCQLDK